MNISRRQLVRTLASGCAAALLPGASYAAVKQKAKPTVAIYVKEMHCASCAKRIAASLYKLPGVVQVATSVKTNSAYVTTQKDKKPTPAQLWEATIGAKLVPIKLVVEKKIYTSNPAAPKTASKAAQ